MEQQVEEQRGMEQQDFDPQQTARVSIDFYLATILLQKQFVVVVLWIFRSFDHLCYV